MTWFTFVSLALLLAPALGAICPDSCTCITTVDGLHRATCSDLAALYKFTLRQKHHNINILDLSHNNITKINHELDRLTEIVSLDLSTNGITELNKFLHNAKKFVHLNLSNNRLRTLKISNIPTSVSSLDLTNNMLEDVPTDIRHLVSLEHLQLEGNPLSCSCENIMARDKLHIAKVVIDPVKCAAPSKVKGHSWLEIKTKDVCKNSVDDLDVMMGDQPIDPSTIEQNSLSLKSQASVDLGTAISAQNEAEDEDSYQFMKVRENSSPSTDEIEGSGDTDSTAIPELMVSKKTLANLELANEEILLAENDHTTDDPNEGSGEGSGFGIFQPFDYIEAETTTETTTQIFQELNPGPVRKFFDESNDTTTEFPLPKPPSVYQGGNGWHLQTEAPITTQKAVSLQATRDTTISEQIRVTQASTIQESPGAEKITPHKTGTYVCIAIIVVLLVGLIGFAIVKGQMRKRRDRRILRQQKRDVENGSKEMVDMNKSLLGKPAVVDAPIQKKVNGNYELVPTHETPLKKSENVGNGIPHENGVKTDSPRDTNQNRNSSKDNNIKDNLLKEPQQETSFESSPGSHDSKKDTNSLSSEDIFVPLNDDDSPKVNGNVDSDASQPLINGDQLTDSDFLSPSREYVPVYSPDMGRVRIKLSETPKPKTPVLVTRSRSNAGDIIITPAAETNGRKSTNT